jgi:hypothetical protein
VGIEEVVQDFVLGCDCGSNEPGKVRVFEPAEPLSDVPRSRPRGVTKLLIELDVASNGRSAAQVVSKKFQLSRQPPGHEIFEASNTRHATDRRKPPATL